MEKITPEEFFKVMFKGIYQATAWCIRKFKESEIGYGILGLILMVVVLWGVFRLVGAIGRNVGEWYVKNWKMCDDPNCTESECITSNIYFHNHYDGKGFVYNKRTGKKTLKYVSGIGEPLGDDSLVYFRKDDEYGYFNKFTGKAVIKPKYDEAWGFSEGVACVNDNGRIKFIDGAGNVVIDKQLAHPLSDDGYVFQSGYCIVNSEDGKHNGLMDKTGKFVLPLDYSYIENDKGLWVLSKGTESAVLDKDLKEVIPLSDCDITIENDEIVMTMPDNTIRKYDLKGNLIHDFYITNVSTLEYATDKIVTHNEKDDSEEEENSSLKYAKATARLKSYAAGNDREGLMTPEGQIVTMPNYIDIEAIGPDLYLCMCSGGTEVIINGKGEMVNKPK